MNPQADQIRSISSRIHLLDRRHQALTKAIDRALANNPKKTKFANKLSKELKHIEFELAIEGGKLSLYIISTNRAHKSPA